MKFYRIKNTIEATQWRVALPHYEEERTGIIRQYKHGSATFWNVDEPLHFDLWFQDFQNTKHRNLGFCDVHPWIGDDVNFDPPLHGEPLSYLLFVSEKLKKVFELFQFPRHRFYQAEVRKQDTGELRTYYLLHLLSDQYKELYYPKVSFSLAQRDTIIRTYQIGEITSYEEFERIKSEEKQKQRFISLTNDNTMYRYFTDFVWSKDGQILISERVASKLAAIPLIGVEFEEYGLSVEFNESPRSVA
jgi:hypothetical protein